MGFLFTPLKKAVALLSPAALLVLLSVRVVALEVNDGEIVVIDYELTEDVIVYAGGTLLVQDGAVINGRVDVEGGSLEVSGGSLPGVGNQLFLEGSSSSVFSGGMTGTDDGTIYIQDSATVRIAGGTWRAREMYVQDFANLHVVDGDFVVSSRVYFQEGATTMVDGGNWAVRDMYLQEESRNSISGGAFSGRFLYFQGTANNVVSGGEFDFEKVYFQGLDGPMQATLITGGVFNVAAGGGGTDGIYVQRDAITRIHGGVFNSVSDLFVLKGSSVTEIKGGSFTSPFDVAGLAELSIVGHSRFNFPLGRYESDSALDGATLTGTLFSGEALSAEISSIEDDGSVVLVQQTNPALIVPVPTVTNLFLVALSGLISLIGLMRLRASN